MTDAARTHTTGAEADRTPAAAGVLRQPYSPPTLRHLGTVKQLTLGSVGPGADADCTGSGNTPLENC